MHGILPFPAFVLQSMHVQNMRNESACFSKFTNKVFFVNKQWYKMILGVFIHPLRQWQCCRQQTFMNNKNQLLTPHHCSVLPKQTLRHDGRVNFGWSHWPHQSYYTPPIPTSKESLYRRLVGPTCLMHAGENTVYIGKISWIGLQMWLGEDIIGNRIVL